MLACGRVQDPSSAAWQVICLVGWQRGLGLEHASVLAIIGLDHPMQQLQLSCEYGACMRPGVTVCYMSPGKGCYGCCHHREQRAKQQCSQALKGSTCKGIRHSTSLTCNDCSWRTLTMQLRAPVRPQPTSLSCQPGR